MKWLAVVLAKRAVAFLPTVVLASFVVFLLLHLVPGDPALVVAGEQATPDRLAAIRDQLGLDEPFLIQYWHWVQNALAGDLGQSLRTREEVTAALARTLPVTLQLVAGALVIAATLGITSGFIAGQRPGGWLDRGVRAASSLSVALPSFWLGLVFVSVFALRLGWLPASGQTLVVDDPLAGLQSLVMPALALGLVGAGEFARQARSAVIDVLDSDSIRTLRAVGVSERSLLWRHAGRNSAIPLLTVFGLQVTRLLGATVVVEVVFGISGMGSLAASATLQKDYSLIQGVLLVMVLVVTVTNLLVDVAYRFVDPRVTA